MKRISIVIFCLSVFYSNAQILPTPTNVIYNSGEFELNKNTKISIDGNIGKTTAEYLVEQLGTSTGFQFKVKEGLVNKGIVFTEGGQELNLGEDTKKK